MVKQIQCIKNCTEFHLKYFHQWDWMTPDMSSTYAKFILEITKREKNGRVSFRVERRRGNERKKFSTTPTCTEMEMQLHFSYLCSYIPDLLEGDMMFFLITTVFCSSLQCPDFSFSVQVDIEVKVTAGTPIKQVILQEIAAYNTTWVIFDRCISFASFFCLSVMCMD